MKYSSQIDINLPINQVIELFDNADNLSKWMKGLQSFEHLSGEPGEVGAKSKLIFLMGKRNLEMIETITVKNLPQEFSGIYEAKGVWNQVKNTFTPISETQTKHSVENEFKFQGIMKLIGFLMPRAFKNQTMKYLVDFKNFAENKI